MRRPRLLIVLFLLATVLVDLVARSLPVRVSGEDNGQIMLLALFFSQVGLVAIWLGLGQTSFPWRIAVGFLILIAWSRPPTTLPGFVGGSTGELAATVAIPLLACKLLGLRLTNVYSAPVAVPAPLGRQRWQFSISSMLGLMTVVAVIMGMQPKIDLKSLLQWRPAFHIDSSIVPHIAPLAAGRAIVAWTALWAALGTRSATLRLVVFIVAVAAAYGGLVATDVGYQYDFWPYKSLFFLEAVLLLGSLWVLRLAGYRVAFRRRGTDAVRTADDDDLPRLPPAPMIPVVCPHCHASVTIPPEYAGQIGYCHHCRGKVNVPRRSRTPPPGLLTATSTRDKIE
jgi:hypothetical protein